MIASKAGAIFSDFSVLVMLLSSNLGVHVFKFIAC